MAKAELTAHIEPRCRKTAEKMGYELVDVCLDREPTGKYLRIYIDKPEGISLDDCEAFHKAIRPMTEDYDYDFMEVSSPGIDRPLKKDRDYERNLGAEIEIHLFRPMNGTRLLHGILAGLNECEIENEFAVHVAHDRQICIETLCNCFANLELQTLWLFFVFCHFSNPKKKG